MDKKQTSYFEQVEQMHNAQKQYKDEMVEKLNQPLTDAQLNEYIYKYGAIISLYVNNLQQLQSELTHRVSRSITDKDNKIFKTQKYLDSIISPLIKQSKQALSMLNNSNYNEFLQSINFTPKEKEILNLIRYTELSYQAIYSTLDIQKRTFNDHLERIAQKIHTHIAQQKAEFPNLIHLFPQYPEKENDDGSSTYANPFTVIRTVLKD